jgi:Phosphotransferase enzyme family
VKGVFTEPVDLDRSAVAEALERDWGIPDARLDYLAIGFGSYHWNAVADGGRGWFVTADDLQAGNHTGRSPDEAFAALERAFGTALALRDEARLEFVVGPLPSRDGTALRRLDERYAIRVEPFVDGEPSGSGEYWREDDRRLMGALLGRLHEATGRLPSGLPVREDFALPGRGALEEALAQLEVGWNAGPFAEPARALLRAHADDVRRRLRRYDEGAERVRGEPDPWVITHGEPHSANVIRDPRGGFHLVDWDTTLMAPRERDLCMVIYTDGVGRDEYLEHAGPVRVREEALDLYRDRWALAEICVYIAEFRRPHFETEDSRASWENLSEYLS